MQKFEKVNWKCLAETILRILYVKKKPLCWDNRKIFGFPNRFLSCFKLLHCCKILIVSFNNEEEGSLYIHSVDILHQQKFAYNGINFNEESEKFEVNLKVRFHLFLK